MHEPTNSLTRPHTKTLYAKANAAIVNATKVALNFFASEALEEPVFESIDFKAEMSPASFVTSAVGDGVGDSIESGVEAEVGQRTGSFLQTQHASFP